jgi:hypothetical protein
MALRPFFGFNEGNRGTGNWLVAEAFADKQTLKCPFPGCSFEAETQGGRRRHIRMQHIEATLEQAQAADDLIRLLA